MDVFLAQLRAAAALIATVCSRPPLAREPKSLVSEQGRKRDITRQTATGCPAAGADFSTAFLSRWPEAVGSKPRHSVTEAALVEPLIGFIRDSVAAAA